MINGIPITLKVPREDNPEECDLLKPVFATIRKHPKLRQSLADIRKANVAHEVAEKRLTLAYNQLVDAANDDEVEKAGDAIAARSEAYEKASENLVNAVHDFVVEGFLGAGYPPEKAEEFAALIPADRLVELKAATMVGNGSLDFTNRAS